MRAIYKQAVIDLLEADPQLAGAVYAGEVTGTPPARYVLLFSTLVHDSDILTGPQSDHLVEITIHSVGSTPDQAEWVAGRVTAALLNVKPVIEGRSSGRIRHTGADPIRYDDSTSPRVWFAADEFSLHTTKG